MSYASWKRDLACSLSLSMVLLANASFAQGNKLAKGGGGSSDPPPPTPPVSYRLDIIPVEGLTSLGQRARYLNDAGQCLCSLESAELTAIVNSDSERTPAIIDVTTGAITYLDNLLTQDTMWTKLPEGADRCDFLGRAINNYGDVVGTAGISVRGVWQEGPYVGFLLKCLRDAEGVVVGYQPIELGPAWDIWLNDMGEMVVQYDAMAHYLRPTDGSQVDFGADFPNSNFIDVHGFNNLGQVLGKQRSASGSTIDTFVWSPDHTLASDNGFFGQNSWGINDFAVVAGAGKVEYQTKEKGKVVTKRYWTPAVLDPVTGPIQLSEHQASFGSDYVPIRINNQRVNDESAVMAKVVVDLNHNLWLKLPTKPSFYLYDALDAEDQALWQSLNYNNSFGFDVVQMSTPRFADGTINHQGAPTIVGQAEPERFNTIGLFVFRPVP